MQALLLSAIKWATFSVACAALLACELTRFIYVVPANGCHLFQMFDINMQRAEACTHKISFYIVVLQPKGTNGGALSQSNHVELMLNQRCVKVLFQPMMWWKGTIAAIKKKGRAEGEKRSMEKRDRVLWEEGECSWRWRWDVHRSAKYAYLFSMPLMGHISLGALCLLPNCKGYLASHLQEICHNKDNNGIWSLCWFCAMLSGAVKTYGIKLETV